MATPQIPVEPKRCEECQKPLIRKRFPSGRLEDRAVYARRKFCDQTCMARNMEGRTKVPNPRNSRRQSAKAVKPRCQICGRRTTRLYVHHLDQDPMHNEETNFLTCCGSCHRRLHSPNYTGIPPVRKPCALCLRPSVRRGYCNTHLTRLKKHGDPSLVKRGNGYGTWLVKLGS